jgi:hypothetical protein
MERDDLNDLIQMMGGRKVPNQHAYQFPNGFMLSYSEANKYVYQRDLHKLIRIINEGEAKLKRKGFHVTYMDKDLNVAFEENKSYYLPDRVPMYKRVYYLEEVDEFKQEALYVER